MDDAVAGAIGGLPGVATRVYGPGDRLLPDHLHGLLVIRDGAIALRVSAGRAVPTIVEILGPDWLLSARHWHGAPGTQNLDATALIQTTMLEVPTDALDRHLASSPHLAVTLARSMVEQQLASLDHLAMLAMRDPFRRVAHALLLLPERFPHPAEPAGSAHLAVSQDLIAAFAGLSRQTTNRQLRRLVRSGVVMLRRQVVELRDRAALCSIAAGRRPPARWPLTNVLSQARRLRDGGLTRRGAALHSNCSVCAVL